MLTHEDGDDAEDADDAEENEIKSMIEYPKKNLDSSVRCAVLPMEFR